MSQRSSSGKADTSQAHNITSSNGTIQPHGNTASTEKVNEEEEVKKQKWTIPKPENATMVCVSSRALFDMTRERKIFEENGLKAYLDYMIKNEDEPLKPGSAFPFIRALNSINEKLIKLDSKEKNLFDVVLMSNNHAQVGIALINSINHHKLRVERICLTAGKSVIGYLQAFNTDLYLSADVDSVKEAFDIGIASAVLNAKSDSKATCEQLRVAFDGDFVLFTDEAGNNVKKSRQNKYFEHESKLADVPLDAGPLQKFAMILGQMAKKFHAKGIIENCPIRTYLVTARSGASSGKRALATLRKWGLDIDEALFLADASKGPILAKIQPHIFFDDRKKNIANGSHHGVPSALVPKNTMLKKHEAGTVEDRS